MSRSVSPTVRAQVDAPGRRELAKAARRTAIVRAARELVQAHGARGFSMQALARTAGVSPMTPYNLFGSKRAVMLAVLDDDLERYEARLGRVRADALDLVFEAIAIARRSYQAEPTFYAAVIRAALSGGSAQEDGAHFRQPRRAIWQRLAQRAVDAGLLLPGPGASLVGVSVSQIVGGSVQDWLAGTLTLAQFEARCQVGVALVLLGVATPPARRRLLARIDAGRKALERSGYELSAPDAPASRRARPNPAPAAKRNPGPARAPDPRPRRPRAAP